MNSGVKIVDLRVCIVLYTDDIVLVSENEQSLCLIICKLVLQIANY